MAGLSTHVLDTARGVPAAGVRVELYRLAPGGGAGAAPGLRHRRGRPLRTRRCCPARSSGAAPTSWSSRPRDYFRAAGVALPDPPFLDEITLRFGIADEGLHYHVPLLVSPWSYSTYRGS